MEQRSLFDEPPGESAADMIEALRAAGGDAWDAIDDPEAYLEGDPPTVWDAAAGAQAKADGMAQAADSRAELLALARRLAVQVALSRPSREVSADDVQQALEAAGVSVHALGNAAGNLFAGKCWEWTGRREKSRRRHAHANELKVWRYVGDQQP